MKFLILVLLVPILALAELANEPPELSVRNRLMEHAGKPALDCGRADKVTKNLSKSSCAIRAYKRNIAFFVQYSLVGTDATTEEGYAFDSQGRLFYVWTISSSALYGGKPSGKIEVHLCKTQSLRILTNGDGELTCDFDLR